MEQIIHSLGFKVVDNRRPCFWHPNLRALMVVYVDDIKIAGPEKGCQEIWRRLGERIVLEDPAPPGRFLCCCLVFLTTVEMWSGR